MNVIRHHHPRAQIVTVTVEEAHRVLHNLSYLRPPQMTLAMPTVEIRLQFRATLLVILDLPEVLPLGTKQLWKRNRRDETWQIGSAPVHHDAADNRAHASRENPA